MEPSYVVVTLLGGLFFTLCPVRYLVAETGYPEVDRSRARTHREAGRLLLLMAGISLVYNIFRAN